MWEEEAEKLSERDMNGRDIKNVVRSAQTLSFEEKVPLNPSHVSFQLEGQIFKDGLTFLIKLETVLSISDEFAGAIKGS
jgi:hypothetical protein